MQIEIAIRYHLFSLCRRAFCWLHIRRNKNLERPTPNAEYSMLTSEFDVGRSALSVGRWALSASCKIDMNIWIGTSGFQYAEWKGNFYPEDLAAVKMLPFYAERLNTTEINYTFHRIPSPKTIDNWNRLTRPNFRFALKAPQKITHWLK